MQSFIRWVIDRYKPKKELTPVEKVETFLQALRHASPDELGGILAVALQAKKTLDTTRLIDIPFPVDILDGHAPLDASGVTRLETYTREMERFRGICVSQGTILTMSVAKGIDTWIVTLLTLTLPAMTEGRELWAFLVQGEANVEAAYRFMVRRDLTDVERDYLTYRPRLLLAG